MKITKEQLRQVIKEELEAVLSADSELNELFDIFGWGKRKKAVLAKQRELEAEEEAEDKRRQEKEQGRLDAMAEEKEALERAIDAVADARNNISKFLRQKTITRDDFSRFKQPGEEKYLSWGGFGTSKQAPVVRGFGHIYNLIDKPEYEQQKKRLADVLNVNISKIDFWVMRRNRSTGEFWNPENAEAAVEWNDAKLKDLLEDPLWASDYGKIPKRRVPGWTTGTMDRY